MALNRRRFLFRSGLATAAGLNVTSLGVGGRADAPAVQKGAVPDRPLRVIHMVADGMSLGTLTLSDHLSQLARGRGLTWMGLMQRPGAVAGTVNMRSLNSLVTDSSAASSSWGSGSRIVNGTVNVLPDGRALTPLGVVFGQAGWKRGLVTTTEITHATPAGFAASGLSRDSAEPIAEQYLERRIEVLLGGGRKFFDPAKRKDKKDLNAAFLSAGYARFQSAAELASAPMDKPWLGTFAESHLPFTLDRHQSAKLKAEIPALADMVGQALRRLDREDRFLLQVEGGRVDHGCHDCDAAAAFNDLMAFDEAVDVVLEYQSRRPETLVVLTTDHGNGNPGLNGMGDKYGQSSPLFASLVRATSSFEAMEKALKAATSIGELTDLLELGTGYRPSEEKVEAFVPFITKKGRSMYDTMNSLTCQLGQLVANHCGVGWTSGSHTADYVPLLALGPGAERFRGFLQNVEIFGKYCSLAGIDFKNPEVPLIAEGGRSAHFAEFGGGAGRAEA